MRKNTLLNLSIQQFSTAHRVLFEKYCILHRDVSVNNTMIYVCDILESQVHDGGASKASHHSEAHGDAAGDSGEQGITGQKL